MLYIGTSGYSYEHYKANQRYDYLYSEEELKAGEITETEKERQ